MRKRILKILAVLAGVLVLLLAFALSPAGIPESSSFQPSLADIRAFAEKGMRSSELPSELRSMRVAISSAPRLLVVPGASLSSNSFVHYTYQIVYPDRTLIVDAVNDEALLKKGFPGGQFFPEP